MPQFALPRAFQYNCRREPCFRVRTIDRYILQELGVPFAQSLAVLTFVLMTREILRLVELLINKGVGLLPLLKTFLLLLPSFFVLTLPMGCLIASISAFSRLSSDRELTALYATGVSTWRLVPSVLLFSSAVFLMTLTLAQFAQPWTGQSLKKMALGMLRDQVSLALDEGVFNTPTDKVVMYVGERSVPHGPSGIFISDTRTSGESRIIVARDWKVITDPLHNRLGLTLQGGTIHVHPKDSDQYQTIRFTTYDFKLDLSESLAPAPEERLSLIEIRQKIAETKGQDPRYLRLLEDHYKNVAFPVSTILFGLIGMPLGIVVKRSGRAGGFAVGILVIVLFYVLNVIGDFWVSARVLGPFAAAWFPDAVFALGIVWLFYRRVHP
jgi:lipopolysaccharide export system permease protein